MNEQKKYKVLATTWLDGLCYEPGQIVTLHDLAAKYLLMNGQIEPVAETPPIKKSASNARN